MRRGRFLFRDERSQTGKRYKFEFCVDNMEFFHTLIEFSGFPSEKRARKNMGAFQSATSINNGGGSKTRGAIGVSILP